MTRRVMAVWHRWVLRHDVVRHGRLQPNYRTSGGINVFVQDKFQAPVPHTECRTCDRTWY
jgi:hypothetical protein